MKKILAILIISIFIFINCEMESKGRFFTKEKYEDGLNQSVNIEVLARIKSDSTMIKDDMIFSFYYITNKRTKIDLLIDYLELNEPSQQLIELNQMNYINEMWELNGRTYPIKLEIDSINKWEKKMWDIGYKFDCELNHWDRTYLNRG